MRRIPSILFVLLLFATQLLALDPSRAITQYGLASWQLESGLPGNRIDALLQTRDGYLWLATQEGLVRFDGVRFTVFDKQSTPQFQANTLGALYEDSAGALWIGSYGGGLTRLKDGAFTHFGTEQGLSDNSINSISESPDGKLVITTFPGVLQFFDGARFQEMKLPGVPTQQNLSQLSRDKQGRLWIGWKQGLLLLDKKEARLFKNDQFPKSGITAVRVDKSGVVWIGIVGGLWRFANEVLAPVQEWNGGSVMDILEDANGTLWFGTEGSGLARLVNGKFEFFNRQAGLTSEIVQTLLQDAEGSLWLGTRGGGLCVLRDQKMLAFTPAEGLSHENVRSLFQDTDGSIWAGTYGGGLSHFHNGVFSAYGKEEGLSSDLISSVVRDSAGVLWIGTKSDGLNRWVDGKVKKYSTEDGLPSKQIFSLYPDPSGGLWIGTSSGLVFLQNEKFTIYTTAQGLSSNVVFSVSRDRDGGLWIGTLKGLNRFHNQKFQAFSMKDGLSSEIILTMYQDSQGTLWIGTVGGGLNSYSKGTFRRFSTAEGLHDDNVYSVLEDGSGRLWLSGNKGISSVRKADLEAFSRSQLHAIPVDVYGTAEGMKSRECNGGTQPSAWKMRDGKLLFPTIRGFVIVDPEKLPVNRRIPPVFLERVLLDGKPAVLKPGDSLPAGSARMEFEYTALSFLAPEKVLFRYRLENFDRDWIDAGRNRSASYTNLPPGDYTFRVIASNNDGVWNETGAAFPFSQKPQFFQTIWFYLLILSGIVLAGMAIHRIRLRQVVASEEKLSRLVKERTLDLSIARERLADANESLEKRVSEGIDALREAERMAAYGSMVAGVAHEVRQPVFALQAAAYVLQERLKENESVSKQLRTLERETKRMGALMDDLLEFAKPPALLLGPSAPRSFLMEALEIFTATGEAGSPEVIIEASESLPRVVMDRGRMLQVLANLMTNARRHASGMTTLRLSADRQNDQILFRVQDNGEGIPDEHIAHIFEPFYSSGKGTGLGLAIVQRIVSDHGGSIKVDSVAGKGTTFIIALPLTDHKNA